MPASYTIDMKRRLVMSSGVGVLTREDLWGHMERLSKDPDFDPAFSQIIDFTNVTEVEVDPEDVRRLAQRNVFSSHSRRSIVVKDDLHFGLARMFEIHRELAGEMGIRVFRTLEEAVRWLADGAVAEAPEPKLRR